MKFYHGTAASSAQTILATSLCPRLDEGNWFSKGQVNSHPEMVYLGTTILQAEFYGLRAALVKGDQTYTVLGIEDLPEDNFYPDENFFTVSPNHIYAEEMLAAQARVLENKNAWKAALEKRGVICHRGAIPPHLIHKEYELPLRENLNYFLVKNNPTLAEFDLRFVLMTACGVPFHNDLEIMSQFRFEVIGNRYNLYTPIDGNYQFIVEDDTYTMIINEKQTVVTPSENS